MDGLNSIEDKDLNTKIKNSINYSLALFELSKNKEHNDLFREETYRVIVLYAISCIEGILFYFYKSRSEKIEALEYRHVHALPGEFCLKGDDKKPLVVAAQMKVEKIQIGLHELVVHFEGLKLIQKDTAKKLRDLNGIRNTHHLAIERKKKCEIADVENAFYLLNYTIDRAPQNLRSSR